VPYPILKDASPEAVVESLKEADFGPEAIVWNPVDKLISPCAPKLPSVTLWDISTALSPGQPIYVAFYAAAIIFFAFFYTALVFNSRETADNLKKSGAFIPGIRPGEQTAKYIDGVMTRLTLVGALYITSVCLLPEFLILYWNVPFYFGGTSLLIIVVVVMDFMAQMQSHMMSQQYEGLMKKANFKGLGGKQPKQTN